MKTYVSLQSNTKTAIMKQTAHTLFVVYRLRPDGTPVLYRNNCCKIEADNILDAEDISGAAFYAHPQRYTHNGASLEPTKASHEHYNVNKPTDHLGYNTWCVYELDGFNGIGRVHGFNLSANEAQDKICRLNNSSVYGIPQFFSETGVALRPTIDQHHAYFGLDINSFDLIRY